MYKQGRKHLLKYIQIEPIRVVIKQKGKKTEIQYKVFQLSNLNFLTDTKIACSSLLGSSMYLLSGNQVLPQAPWNQALDHQ